MHSELAIELTESHMILLLRPSLLFVGALKRFEGLMVGIRVHCQGGLLACVVDVGYLEISLATYVEVHPTLLLSIQLGVLHQQGHIPYRVLNTLRRLAVIVPESVVN
jgi:hypothetical protein